MTINTEDKEKWLKEGERLEKEFVKLMTLHSNIKIEINPEKLNNSKAPDLIAVGYGRCELKARQTPFFTAMRYGIDPGYAVTINKVDVDRYKLLYPHLGIFFWVDWKNTEPKNPRHKPVKYHWGIYFCTVNDLKELIDSGLAPAHEYLRRKDKSPSKFHIESSMNSDMNATISYVLDCRWLSPIAVSSRDPWV